MADKKNILTIVGSASSNSVNHKLIDIITHSTGDKFNIILSENLRTMPHFNPELSVKNPPEPVKNFIKSVEQADGVIICTPEYVFSIPSLLKNAIEWCLSSTIFTNKPAGLITASTLGEKAHEQLQLIMKTLMANFSDESTLLISGIKGKIDAKGKITAHELTTQLDRFIKGFVKLFEGK